MSRPTRFERGLLELHGPAVLEAAPDGGGAYEVRPIYVRPAHQPGSLQLGRGRKRVDHVAFRIGAGLLGLFWVIVLGGALVAFVIVAGVMIYAAFTT